MDGLRNALVSIADARAADPFAWVAGEDVPYGVALDYAQERASDWAAGESVVVILPKGIAAYLAIFAAIANGATYIPLNPAWNASRIWSVLDAVAPDHVVCGAEFLAAHADHLRALGFLPRGGNRDAEDWAAPVLLRRASDRAGAAPLDAYRARTGCGDLLYVMFTSGSTGVPKGVPVPTSGVAHYLRAMRETFALPEGESWSQAVELNFDLSVHDMLLAWTTGGRVVSIPAEQAQMGPRFVRGAGIHNWLSVPSAAAQSMSLRLLKPASMPGLRRAFFCGEALASDVARAWGQAAPNAPVLNIYGPTEATIAFTWHRFDARADTGPSVPIGVPLPGNTVRLSAAGELELGGPQVFHGYLRDPADTAALSVEGGRRWYRSGDRCHAGGDGVLTFAGRMDSQVKVKGNRIELAEVEHALRAVTGSGLATVVPVREGAPGAYEGLVGFVEEFAAPEGLRERLAQRLPAYMLPEAIRSLAAFPRNANGKIDRLALNRMAEEAEWQTSPAFG